MLHSLIDNFLLVKPNYLIPCTILVGGYLSYKYYPKLENNIRIQITNKFIHDNMKNYKTEIFPNNKIVNENIKYSYKVKEATFSELENKYKNDLLSDKITKEIIDFTIKDYLKSKTIKEKYIFIDFKVYKSIFEIENNNSNSNVLTFNLQADFDKFINDKVLLNYLDKEK